MRSIKFLTLFFFAFGLYSSVVSSEELTAQNVADAFRQYKKGKEYQQ